MVGDLAQRGWARIGFDPAVSAWAGRANTYAEAAMSDAALAQWWVCGNTWFVGVDALNNDACGALPDGTPLPPIPGINSDAYPLHKAQVSVVRPGYPKPREGEGEAAFRYRLKRDAAHVDGLKASGPARRRRIEEPHAYILGLPLNDAPPEAAPLVVWEGSPEIMRRAFRAALAPYPQEDWGKVDVTVAYQEARREVFETCKRVTVYARPGEAYILHRLSLHGVAPWAAAPKGDRRIAYFRPAMETVREWLEKP